MFKIGATNEPRLAVRTASIVGGGKAVETEHAPASLGELVERGAADPAGADNNRIVMVVERHWRGVGERRL